MCILRYTPTTRPSASITAALLWYRPGARRSNRGAITTTPARRAARPIASVLGPGTGSARSNMAASSRCAKYCERNSSGRHTRRAPAAAASATFAIAFSRFAAGSGDIAICTSPMAYLCGAASVMGKNTTRALGPATDRPRTRTSGIDDFERRLHLIVGDAAQRHGRDVTTRHRCGIGRNRNEAAKQAAQPDDDALAVAGGRGQGCVPAAVLRALLSPHPCAHDVVGREHEVELRLAVIVDRVHQQGLYPGRLALARAPRETVRDGGESHDRQLRKRELHRGSLGAGRLHLPQVLDRDPRASGERGGERHATHCLHEAAFHSRPAGAGVRNGQLADAPA